MDDAEEIVRAHSDSVAAVLADIIGQIERNKGEVNCFAVIVAYTDGEVLSYFDGNLYTATGLLAALHEEALHQLLERRNLGASAEDPST